jgi:alpha-tubulin suppressor-like RCC1 family protein
MKQQLMVIESAYVRCRGSMLACVVVFSLSACLGDAKGGAITGPDPSAGSFVAVTAGWKHSCALTSDGKAWCWGENTDRGQLGDGSWEDRNRPVEVAGGLTFQSLSGGAHHTCGVAATGQAYCWGRNDYGQLGSGREGNSNVPVLVAGTLRFRSVSAGEFSTCGLTTTDRAYCWGGNNRGQLGTGMGESFISTTPIGVTGDLHFEALSVGHQHACGVTTDGKAFCWGRNVLGALGDGSHVDRNRPVPVSTDLTFSTQIGASQFNACALTTAGRAYCWGDNMHNQVGNNAGRASFSTPQPVADVPDFHRLGVGGDHACALTPAGEAWCWGDNMRGPLGYFSQTDYNPARPVPGGLTFATISGGGWDHYCAATASDGQLYCWGWNNKGQLGDGTTHGRHHPVPVRFR